MSKIEALRDIARQTMLDRGLEPEFSVAASKQAADSRAAAPAVGAGVRDLTALPWASIDNDDSRDLDQLSVSQPAPNGAVRILVAIADVDAVVAAGSPVDAHARLNTTSVYTVPLIFPMLPERLSTDITSLAEGQVRVATVVDMSIHPSGELQSSEIYRALVLNRAKLAYESVGAWLEGRGPVPQRVAALPGLDVQLRIQDGVAQTLKSVRHSRGALALETLEASPVFDGASLIDLTPDHKNRAHELIEDFMIAANGVTARYLQSAGFPSIRRVLRTPEKWSRLAALAAQLGERLPAEPSAAALSGFLASRRQADPQGFADLSLSVVKLLGRGQYVLDEPGGAAPGHFGLAVSDYTHSTAPNRRFPDLLTQRLLKASLEGRPAPYTADELSSLALHCTSQEDNAAKVERRVAKSAAAMLLASRVGHTFDGIVTGAAAKGTWVRISSPTTEGRVVRGFQGLEVGERIKVKLVHTDMARGYIDFERSR